MAKIISILLTDELNGVTTFNYTLLKQLKGEADDCEVMFLTKVSGGVKDKFTAAGINVVQTPSGNYNYIILNNRTGLNYAIDSVTPAAGAKWAYYVHSLMNEESMPPLQATLPTIALNIFTFSANGKTYLESLGHTVTQITNGIDLARFASGSASTSIRKVLVLDVRNADEYKQVICNISSLIPLAYFRSITVPEWDIEVEIAEADMVVAYGRSAIEAMAMGKHTVIYGTNGGDGLVQDANKVDLAASNFSGWSKKRMPIPTDVCELDFISEIAKINQTDANAVRDWIRLNYGIAAVATALKA